MLENELELETRHSGGQKLLLLRSILGIGIRTARLLLAELGSVQLSQAIILRGPLH